MIFVNGEPRERAGATVAELLADLEVESRGGGGGALSEDTAAVRAVIAAAR